MKPDQSHSGTPYRPEIDGLRAVAVIPVILFHAGVVWCKGGFLGVDVFFVISGYLITSIILGDRAVGKFSIATFYERRARRILPALFLVITVCIPFAVALMLPVELERFSKSTLAVLLFVPNVFFWLTTSYFDTSSQQLPLLHTWSLGVEEQFYVVFPLIVVAAWRPNLRRISVIVVLLALISLALSEWGWRSGKLSASFFLVPTRAWELLLGSLLAIAWQSRPIYERVSPSAAQVLSMTGLLVLGSCIAFFSETTPMPSLIGLLPTVGTALIIAFAKPGTVVQYVLSRRVLVWIGLVSYSAYLWHQPLFAFSRMATGNTPSPSVFAGLIGLTFLLAYLTWRYVEGPFRSRRSVERGSLVAISVVWAAILAALAGAGYAMHGMAERLNPVDRALAAMADTTAQGRYVIGRFVSLDRDFSPREPGRRRMLVLGDSYAQDFVNASFEAGMSKDIEVRTGYVSADCQIYFGEAGIDAHVERRFIPVCRDQHASAATWRRIREADVIVLVSSWREWAVERLPETLRALHLGPEQRALVVGTKSFGEVDVKSLLRLGQGERLLLRQPPSQYAASMNDLLKRIVPATQFVDIQSAVCDTSRRCPLFDAEGRLLSFDGTHLTHAGATVVGTAIWSREPLATWARAKQ